VQNRIQTVMVLGLVVLALVGGAGQAAAGQQPRGASAPQIGWAARSQPVPGPRPSAPSSSAPAGDRRGNAVVTAAALLLALGSRPIRRRRRGRRWGRAVRSQSGDGDMASGLADQRLHPPAGRDGPSQVL
jgi:hypothetical protein